MKTLLKVLWVIIAFTFGYQMLEVSLVNEIVNGTRDGVVDFTIKRLIFALIGIGAIGVGMTRCLILVKDLLTRK